MQCSRGGARRSAAVGQRPAWARLQRAARRRARDRRCLAGLAGLTPAFAVNAASFFASAVLLTLRGPLPPSSGSGAGGIIADAWAGLRQVARAPVLRDLGLGTVAFVALAPTATRALGLLVVPRL